jgi:hypothetical protein
VTDAERKVIAAAKEWRAARTAALDTLERRAPAGDVLTRLGKAEADLSAAVREMSG